MRLPTLLLATLMLCLPTAVASTRTDERVPAARFEHIDGPLKLTVFDVSPRFLDFYAAARDADADTRWALWDRKYGFAAVPPTPEGRELARTLLDGAWARYPAALPAIQAGAGAMQPQPIPVLRELAALLEFDEPFEMDVWTFVGGFEMNAFAFASEGRPAVAIPLEMNPEERELVLRHEMAHAVHMRTAGLSGGWERSIAQTVISEGLAMHAAKALVPGREDREYIEHRPGWFAESMAKAPLILKGLEPMLEASDSDTVFRFTMGQGTTGTEREAYVAGWVVIDELLRQGRTLPELARVRSEDMPALVRGAIASIGARQ